MWEAPTVSCYVEGAEEQEEEGMDVTEKAKGMASKKHGLVAPADLPQLQGPRPVLDNRWGVSLAKHVRSPSITGKKK